MKIAILGVGHIGSTVGRLWHAAGHNITFAARDTVELQALAAELGERAHVATVPDGVAGAQVVLVAVPGPAVVDVLTAAGSLDGQVVIDAANMMGDGRLSLRQLADKFPGSRWVRAFNTLQARVLAEENHREPRWVLFFSGDEAAKPTVARLIEDAGFEPADLGGIDDSQFQEPGSSLWNTTLEADEAKALAARVQSGDATAADPLTAPFEKLRDHAPADPAFFFGTLFYWSIWRKHLKIALTPSAARAASIRFGAGNLAYLVAIGVAFLSAPASLLISGLVAVYYVFEHTPARPAEAPPGYSLIPGAGGGRQSPADVLSGPDEYRAH